MLASGGRSVGGSGGGDIIDVDIDCQGSKTKVDVNVEGGHRYCTMRELTRTWAASKEASKQQIIFSSEVVCVYICAECAHMRVQPPAWRGVAVREGMGWGNGNGNGIEETDTGKGRGERGRGRGKGKEKGETGVFLDGSI